MATFLTRIFVATMLCILTCTIGLADQGWNGPSGLLNSDSYDPGWLPAITMPLDENDSRSDQEDWLEFHPVVVPTTHLQNSLLDPPKPRQDQQPDSLFELGFQALLDSMDKTEPAPTEPLEPLDPMSAVPTELAGMVQRIDELETIIQANEDATRTIIRQTFSEQGSKINEFVTFGGTLEVLTAWEEDFDGESASAIVLDTAQLDFEVQVNDWTLGSLIFEYDDGLSLLFPTSTGNNSGIDRINVDTAFFTIGDTQRFCLYATGGRVITPFGISTGAAKGQVLNLIDPLTVEVFETRKDVWLIGFEGPTPPPPPPVSTTPVPPPPQVKPQLLNPLVSRLSQRLGYRKPPPPRPPTPVPAPYVPKKLPLKGEIYFYSSEAIVRGLDKIEHMGGMLGYRTEGYFRRCLPIIAPVPNTPWSMDFDVNVTSSVFDSRFLEFEYLSFLEEIGYVPGMAAHASSAFGPLSLIAEWNGAISSANFEDDLGPVSITPGAWQVSMGYQFDWNPSVVEVGAQGTYFALGYSESYDLAGVTQLIDGEQVRVGFVPEKRFVVGMGEWVLDGLRVAVEYSHIVDYPVGEGLGSGGSANGFFGVVTYEW
jgi:hypothetical protein